MEEIFVVVDANGGNAGEMFLLEALNYDNLFHIKINHRPIVLEKTIEFLGE